MQWMTRMVCTAGLLSAGCAAMGGGSRGEVLFVVETDQALGRLVFGSDGGMSSQLAGAEEGVTIYRQLAQPGTYCLQEVTTGNLSVTSFLQKPLSREGSRSLDAALG